MIIKYLVTIPAIMLSPLAMASLIGSASQTQANPGFALTNNAQSGASAALTFSTVGAAGIPVLFSFSDALYTSPQVLAGSQAATLTMSATSMTPADVSGTGGKFINQQIDSGTITITRDTPVNGKNLLLKVVFQNANLSLTKKSAAGSVSVSDEYDAAVQPTHTVSYTSDFLSFPVDSLPSFSLALSGIKPTPTVQTNGLVNDFSASGSASFSVEGTKPTPIPEPATYGMIIAGLVLATAVCRRAANKS
jgi:hypothetical protein